MDTTKAFTIIAQAMNDFINTLPPSARAGTNQYLQEAVNTINSSLQAAQSANHAVPQKTLPPKPKRVTAE